MNEKRILGIYMPSYGRRIIALESLTRLRHQIQNLDPGLLREFKVEVFLAVNSDESYKAVDFVELADFFHNRAANLGGDINIGLGFSESILNKWDYLWIVGDDEPLGEKAVQVILQEILESDPDLIVGSKGTLDLITDVQSFQELNGLVSGTLTFISSCIYKRAYSKEMVEKCLEFAFTSYSHVCMQNLLIEQSMLQKVAVVEMQLLCDYHYKVLQDPLKPRREYAYRDSRVFFGKILTPLVTDNQKYIRGEFLKWWKSNWHRFSMYSDVDDFRADLVFGYSRRFLTLYPWLLLSLFPYWRVKEVIRPVPSSRIMDSGSAGRKS